MSLFGCSVKPKLAGHSHQSNVLMEEPGHGEEEHRATDLLEESGTSSQSHQLGSKPRVEVEIKCC